MPDKRNITETIKVKEARVDEMFTVILVLALVLGLWLFMMHSRDSD
jgi:hypothetical protein